jgi:hypothetical protein
MDKYDWAAMRKQNHRFEWAGDVLILWRVKPHGLLFINANGKIRQWSKCTVAGLLDSGEMVAVPQAIIVKEQKVA